MVFRAHRLRPCERAPELCFESIVSSPVGETGRVGRPSFAQCAAKLLAVLLVCLDSTWPPRWHNHFTCYSLKMNVEVLVLDLPFRSPPFSHRAVRTARSTPPARPRARR